MYLDTRLPTYLPTRKVKRREKGERKERKEKKLGRYSGISYKIRKEKNKEILYLRYVYVDRQINVDT